MRIFHSYLTLVFECNVKTSVNCNLGGVGVARPNLSNFMYLSAMPIPEIYIIFTTYSCFIQLLLMF